MSGTASGLNACSRRVLRVSVVSAVEYARNAVEYHLLPDLAITCDGPVHSVALFSRRPPAELDGRTILITASSRTSVLLLELLCRHRWGVRPHFVSARAEAPDLAGLEGLPHEAVLVIGDAALLLAAQSRYPCVWTSARRGRNGRGCRSSSPYGRRGATLEPRGVKAVHRGLLESRAWGLAHLDQLAAEAHRRTGVGEAACRAYLGDLDYALSYRHLAGLTDFFGRLAAEGLVPDGSLSFIRGLIALAASS